MNGLGGTILRILLIVALVYAGYYAVSLVFKALFFAFKLLIPVLVVGGVYLLVTRTNAGRALIGGRRSLP